MDFGRWLDEHMPSTTPSEWTSLVPKDHIHPVYSSVAIGLFIFVVTGMAIFHMRTTVRPGVYFGLLAVEALLVTIFAPPGTWEKALVLVIGIGFCAGEIVVVQRLGSAADIRTRKILKQTSVIQKQTSETQRQTSEIQRTVLDMGNVLSARLKSGEGTLKEKALLLSYDILSFVAGRQQDDPSAKSLPSMTTTFYTDFAQSMREQNENLRRSTDRNNAIWEFQRQTATAYDTAFSHR